MVKCYGRVLNGGAGGKLVRKNRGVLRTAGGEAEKMRNAANVSQTLRRTEWPKEAAANARRIYGEEAESIAHRPNNLPLEKLSLRDDIAIVMFAVVFLACGEKSKDQCVCLRLSEVRLIHHLNIEEPPSTPRYEFFRRVHENRARVKERLKLFNKVLLA